MQKADLQWIVKNNCKHLSADYQKKLLQRLFKFELLSDGILGDWSPKPVSFQIERRCFTIPGPSFPSTKNTHWCPHQVSWETVQTWGYLNDSAIQSGHRHSTNKEPPCFPSDFQEVNKRLNIKPFSIPKISTVLQSLKTSPLQQRLISTWVMTPLDWIQMHPKICTINFPLG